MLHEPLPLDPAWSSWAERLRWHLSEIPGLLVTLSTRRAPMKVARYDREIVSGSGADEAPAPVNVEVVDDLDALWRGLGELGGLAGGWLERRGVWDEDLGSMAYDEAPTIGRAVNLREASALIGWLGRRALEIQVRDELRTPAEALCERVRKLRSRYLVDRAASRPLLRRCTVCEEVAVMVEVAEIKAFGRVVGVGRCGSCGQMYEEKDG